MTRLADFWDHIGNRFDNRGMQSDLRRQARRVLGIAGVPIPAWLQPRGQMERFTISQLKKYIWDYFEKHKDAIESGLHNFMMVQSSKAAPPRPPQDDNQPATGQATGQAASQPGTGQAVPPKKSYP